MFCSFPSLFLLGLLYLDTNNRVATLTSMTVCRGSRRASNKCWCRKRTLDNEGKAWWHLGIRSSIYGWDTLELSGTRIGTGFGIEQHQIQRVTTWSFSKHDKLTNSRCEDE
jgi:hypothetical protein